METPIRLPLFLARTKPEIPALDTFLTPTWSQDSPMAFLVMTQTAIRMRVADECAKDTLGTLRGLHRMMHRGAHITRFRDLDPTP